MSAKIDIAQVVVAMESEQITPAAIRAVVEKLNLAAQSDDEESLPAIKKQFVILASDPDNYMQSHRFVAWVLQIPEDESVATTQERIFRAAYDYNASKKGRLYPAKTVGEAIENVPTRFFREADVWAKTKTPVLVLRTDNQIPKEKSE
jgi:hypothetical protein